jgi:hypothetical protein
VENKKLGQPDTRGEKEFFLADYRVLDSRFPYCGSSLHWHGRWMAHFSRGTVALILLNLANFNEIGKMVIG